MPTDRSADRHRDKKAGRFFRPDPPDLWDRLSAVVGARNIGKTISALIAAFLDGTALPEWPRPGIKPETVLVPEQPAPKAGVSVVSANRVYPVVPPPKRR